MLTLEDPQSNIEILYALAQPSTKVSQGKSGQLRIESEGELFHASRVSSHLFADTDKKPPF